MNLNELELYLDQTVSPERAEILVRAADLLTKLGYTAHEYPILESMMAFDDADPGTVVMHISEILLESLKTLLRVSSITIRNDVEESHIPILCDIVNTLSTATDQFDSGNLLEFVGRDDEAEDLLAEMVSLLTPSPIEMVRDVIEKFRQETMDSLLTTFRREAEAREDSMIGFHDIQRQRRAAVVIRLRKYMQRFNPSIAKKLVISGFELGLDEPEVYHAVMEDILTATEGPKFIEELVGVMLLTDKTPQEVIDITRDSIEEINFEDPNETMKAYTWLEGNKDNILGLLQEETV